MKKIYHLIITLILILLLISTYNLKFNYLKLNSRNKKIVVINGFDTEKIAKFFNPVNYFVIELTKPNLELSLGNNILIDIYISKFNIDTFDNTSFINNIEHVIKIIKPNGKIINFNSDRLLNNIYINEYFKEKALYNYRKKICFSVINIDASVGHDVINFITDNNWNVLTGRTFLSSRINGKQIGYYLDLEYPYLNTNTLIKKIIANKFNGENVIKPNIKEQELTVYSNSQNILINKLSQNHNIDTSYIQFHSGIISFLERMVPVFVPKNHEIISWQMNYLEQIGKSRKIIHTKSIINNHWAEPDYEQILSNITSLTRMIYLVAPLNKKQFDNFINNVPFNIPILIDFCYNEFIINPDNIKMEDYLQNSNTIICINSFSKFYGLPGIHLSYSISKKDINTIISNYFHYPLNSFYEKLVIQSLDESYINSVRSYYNEQRNKIISILSNKTQNYWFEFPNTIVIEIKGKTESYIIKYLESIKLSNYYAVSKNDFVNLIKLFLSTSNNNTKIINKIMEIL
jgi:histidinol-phosphate/aromatic aminotransferase/cobyric acid decarboxylase-like protein